MVDTDAVAHLRVAISKLARELNATATGEGLTPTQASVLALVSARGPLGLAPLADMEGLNPTMLSRVVSRLGELGLIRRLPDPTDLRAAQVEVTPAGKDMHQRIRARRTEVVARCMQRLPEETVRTLLDAVPALQALADELRTDDATTQVPRSGRGSRQ